MSEGGPVDTEKQAKQRLLAMTIVRFIGIAGVMLGIAMTRGVVTGYPGWLGYVVAIAGLAAFLLGPYAMVRHWKGPKE